MKKHVSLSQKSLDKVGAWSQENDKSDPLATGFIGACIGVGNFDASNVCDRLEKSWKGKDKYGYIKKSFDLRNELFQVRDNIGRVILEMLKREEKDV